MINILRLQVTYKCFFKKMNIIKEEFNNLGSTVTFTQKHSLKKTLKAYIFIRKKVPSSHSLYQFNLKISSRGKLLVTKL